MSIKILTKLPPGGAPKSLTNLTCLFFNRTTPIGFTRSYLVRRSIASMRFIRFQRNSDKNGPIVGVLSEDGKSVMPLDKLAASNDMIELIKTPSLTERVQDVLKSAQWQPLSTDIKLLAPIHNPEKIVCIGLNYLGHCQEQNKEAPKEPMFFSKFASTITGPTGDVILHEPTKQLDWEVELAVIIGKEAKRVSKANAFDYVFGYSVAQDISARDWQKTRNGGQFLIGKSMDTFCPLGPAIVHKSLVLDPHNLSITCDINGVRKQAGNTNELIFRIDDIIHLLSQ